MCYSTKWLEFYDSCTYVHTAGKHIVLYFLISDIDSKNNGGSGLVVCLVWSWKVFIKDISHSEGQITPWWALGRSSWKLWHLVRMCAPCVAFCLKQNHCCVYPNWQYQVSVWDQNLFSLSSGEVWIHSGSEVTLGSSTAQCSLLRHYSWTQIQWLICPFASAAVWDGDKLLLGSYGSWDDNNFSGSQWVWMCLSAF